MEKKGLGQESNCRNPADETGALPVSYKTSLITILYFSLKSFEKITKIINIVI